MVAPQLGFNMLRQASKAGAFSYPLINKQSFSHQVPHRDKISTLADLRLLML
jgi:hypothetical protein